MEPYAKCMDGYCSPWQLYLSGLSVPMGKYCYGKGRRKVIEAFSNREGLWILAVVTALSIGTLVLYMIGYLHLDGD